MFWSMASFTQHLSKQSDFHFIILAVTTSRKHVLRTKLYKMRVICSLSSKALKNNPCFAGCPANGSRGELSFGKLRVPAQKSQPLQIFSDGVFEDQLDVFPCIWTLRMWSHGCFLPAEGAFCWIQILGRLGYFIFFFPQKWLQWRCAC